MNKKYGFDISDWNATKKAMRCFLQWTAKKERMISYSDLVLQVGPIRFEADDGNFWHMLGEISLEEDAHSRGMLTAVVVHKSGNHRPGGDFFELANQLGRDTSDRVKCWIDEVKKVHAFWSEHTPPCDQPNTVRIPEEEYRELRRLERKARER